MASFIPVSNQTNSSVNSSAKSDDYNPKYPLWKYVTKLEKIDGSQGGNARSKCTFCGHIISGSYSRVKAHLLKISCGGTKVCPKVTVPILEELRKEVGILEVANLSLDEPEFESMVCKQEGLLRE
ncbi:hypothetical protein ABZP36_015983 [Zizania latifolia]